MGNAFRSRKAKVAEFVSHREPQSDVHYLAECGLPAEPFANRVALAVRASVASVGWVDPAYIRATDRFPDELINLPGWDSIDLLDWIFRLEFQLSMKISRNAFAAIRQPFAVKELASATYEYLKGFDDF